MAGNNEMKWLGLLLVVVLLGIAVPVLAVDVTITATPNYTGVPIVTCSPALNITGISAVLVGNITHTGNDNATIRGFDWGYSTGNYTSSWNETGNFSAGVFYHTIMGLTPGVEVFSRAFAVNGYGQGNSTECSFTGLLLPPINFTATAVGTSSANLTWIMDAAADTVTIRMSEDGYPQNITDGVLIYSGNETYVVVNGLNLDTATYYFSAWSENAFGYSVDHAEAQVGGEGMAILVFGILPLGFLGLFLWKRLAFLSYASAGMWALFGFFAFQTSTSPSPAQIEDIYMALFWVCVALVITMALLPLAMREKKEPEELYVDELDQPLETFTQGKKHERTPRQKPSRFAENGKM